MAEKMYAYLKSQPRLWQQVFDGRAEALAAFRAAVAPMNIRHVLMIGSGSSYNAACCTTALYAKLLGVQAIPCAPTQADEFLCLLQPQDTLVVLISQSGASTSTQAVLSEVKQRGFYTVGLTSSATSPIARESDLFVLLPCGEETVGPKTKGFTITVLMLQLMALCLCRDTAAVAGIEAELSAAFAAAPAIIEASADWAKQNSRLMRCAPYMLILAESSNRAVMKESALKVLECLYVPSMEYEFEEYLHGVQCTIAQGSHLLLVVPDNHNRERMLRLAAFNEAHGGVSYIISTQAPCGVPGELFLPGVSGEYAGCYNVLLPFQVMSALVCADKGINCDLPKFPTFISEMSTKNYQ